MDDGQTPDNTPLPGADDPEKGLKAWHYIVGATALVPYLGLPSALLTLLFGIQKRREGGIRLLLLAALGFGSTAWYGGYLPWGRDPGHSAASVQKKLTHLVRDIEDFRAANGRLPARLPDLTRGDDERILDLPTTVAGARQSFYYGILPGGNSYYLFSRGPDGEAFTPDDILPTLTNQEKSRWGYRVRPIDYSASSTLPSATPGGSEPQALRVIRWRDPADGLAEARRTGKHLLLDFTAEWCTYCKRMESEVFIRPEYARYVNRHFVPIKVLDRRNEEHHNPPLVDELQQRFEVRGFPTLVAATIDYRRSETQRGYIGDLSRNLAFLKRFAEP